MNGFGKNKSSKNFHVRLTGVAHDRMMNHDNDSTDIYDNTHEVCMIDAGIHSIAGLRLPTGIHTLNLHCNQITSIDGLTGTRRLHHLDLSSNQIAHIEGLESLTQLRTLNLSCNHIRTVSGLGGLRSLRHLNLSYNHITDLTGLVELTGPLYSLTHIEIQGNQLDSINHIVECIAGLVQLRALTLVADGNDNPVCSMPGYRTALLQSLPTLQALDHRNRQGQHVTTEGSGLNDIPGLDKYIDYLINSDSDISQPAVRLVTPKIDQMLDRFRQRAALSVDTTSTDMDTRPTVNITTMKQTEKSAQAGVTDHESRLEQLEKQLAEIVTKRRSNHGGGIEPRSPQRERQQSPKTRRAKRDTDKTDESDGGDSCHSSTAGNTGRRHRAKNVKKPRVKQTRLSEVRQRRHAGVDEGRSRPTPASSPTDGQTKSRSTTHSSPSSGLEVKGRRGAPRVSEHPQRARGPVATTAEQDADKLMLMKELDGERERRWKAEQAAIRLADHIKDLHSKGNEERDLQDVAILASTRLKQALMNEKESRIRLEDRLEECKTQLGEAHTALAKLQKTEEDQRQALRAMETTSAKMESERLNQHAHESKKTQEYQMRAAAVGRELDLVRAQGKQQDDKIRQLQELLASREQEHRQQLNDLYRLDSKELKDVISREVTREQSRHEQEGRLQKERTNELARRYAELEDEFRLALTMEAERFREVQRAFERATEETALTKQALATSADKEKRASGVVAELTAMVKEQKGRITELSRSRQETSSMAKERIQTLESQLEESRRVAVHIESLRKEKSRLDAQIIAQESIIDGLKAERKLWGQELAQQGVSLAQDRGRLEARIEALSAEVTSLKKQSERDSDSIRIKTKMLDDQTDSIKKLKEGLVERDNEIKRIRDETLHLQRDLEQQLAGERALGQDAGEEVDRLKERKEELKEKAADLQAELDEARRAYRTLDGKWKEKGDLIGQLETQVRQVKTNFDAKEKRLTDERNKAVEAERLAVERLHHADNAFTKQLETIRHHHEGEKEDVRRDQQKQLETAQRRIFEVEDEMRQLLAETSNQKLIMDQKMTRLTSAFNDLTQGLA